MALVLETGTGLTNANSYASVAEADEYNSVRGNTAWAEVTSASAIVVIRCPIGSGDTFTINGVDYLWIDVLDGPTANRVVVGATDAESLQNLVKAINASGTPGLEYGENTLANEDVTITDFTTDGTATITAREAGTAGNSITLAAVFSGEGIDGGSFIPATLTGGTSDKEQQLIKATDYLDRKYRSVYRGTRNTSTQALCWPRTGVVTEDGVSILSNEIPRDLKHAVIELARSGQSTELAPDLEYSANTTMSRVKVGPIEVEDAYASKGQSPVFTRAMDAIRPLLKYSPSSMGFMERG